MWLVDEINAERIQTVKRFSIILKTVFYTIVKSTFTWTLYLSGSPFGSTWDKDLVYYMKKCNNFISFQMQWHCLYNFSRVVKCLPHVRGVLHSKHKGKIYYISMLDPIVANGIHLMGSDICLAVAQRLWSISTAAAPNSGEERDLESTDR